jgi:hypothetical protein
MKIERTDDELVDFWSIAMPEGIILVTEEDAKRIKELVQTNTVIIQESEIDRRDAFICPFYVELVDLFGAETSIRLDQVGTITHVDEAIRELSKRQDVLLEQRHKKHDWE